MTGSAIAIAAVPGRLLRRRYQRITTEPPATRNHDRVPLPIATTCEPNKIATAAKPAGDAHRGVTASRRIPNEESQSGAAYKYPVEDQSGLGTERRPVSSSPS